MRGFTPALSTAEQIDFFGFQLLEYLLDNVVPRDNTAYDTWQCRLAVK